MPNTRRPELLELELELELELDEEELELEEDVDEDDELDSLSCLFSQPNIKANKTTKTSREAMWDERIWKLQLKWRNRCTG